LWYIIFRIYFCEIKLSKGGKLLLKIIVIIIIAVMLILFSILLRKHNKQINEEFKGEDNKTSIKTSTSKTDSLEDSDIEAEGGGE